MPLYERTHKIDLSSNSDGGDDRLVIAVAFATGMACERHRIAPDVFRHSLLAVHDHKGILSCLWRDEDSAATFGCLFSKAWDAFGEIGDSVEQFVAPGRMVFIGPNPSHYPDNYDRKKPWPGL